MNTKLIAAALMSAAATLASPAFAQDAAVYGAQNYGTQNYGRSAAAVVTLRSGAFRGVYNQAQIGNPAHVEPEFSNNGWVGEGAIDRSRPGGLDPDFRPSAN